MRQLHRRLQPPALILMYHRITDHQIDPWSICVSPAHFAEHMEVLRRRRTTMSLPSLHEALRKDTIPRGAVAITFDDGYADNFLYAKPILDRAGLPATMFICTDYLVSPREYWWDMLERVFLLPGSLPDTPLRIDLHGHAHEWSLTDAKNYSATDFEQHRHWLAETEPPPGKRQEVFGKIFRLLHPLGESARQEILRRIFQWANLDPNTRPAYRVITTDELLRLDDTGLIEIGSHSVTHPCLSACSIEAQRGELQQSKSWLEKTLNRSVTSFAYPYGIYDNHTADLVTEAGYRAAYTTQSAQVRVGMYPFLLPRFQVDDYDGEEFERRLEEWTRPP